ncbi:MAG: hypothetical protein AAGE85_06640 [Pseudomonadota bacterium]
MLKKPDSDYDRARQMVAQEAARLIVEQGMRDYRAAKLKAAERLGLDNRGSLPGNAEIEQAVAEHHKLFGGEEHVEYLAAMRTIALSAMQVLAEFEPRLVGPVLNGTADDHSAVNIHVFADSPETVAFSLADSRIRYRSYERRLKSRRGQIETYAGFSFRHEDGAVEAMVEATVFPFDGLRQAPISPIDGRPMRRADRKAVNRLLAGAD